MRGVRRTLNRPASLPNLNHEGITIAPATECKDGKKAVYWIQDGTSDVLRCGRARSSSWSDSHPSAKAVAGRPFDLTRVALTDPDVC